MEIVNRIMARLRRIPLGAWLVVCGLMVGGGYMSWLTATAEVTKAESLEVDEKADAHAVVQEALLDGQEESALRAIEAELQRFPPSPTLTEGRRAALTKLDAILQSAGAPKRAAVQRFFHRRIEAAADAMQQAQVRSGATVWQIYNHGFVVRTQSATLCFDLVRAKYLPGFALSQQTMRRIVQACDILFVSHVHADHAESFVAQTFVDQGKPVVAPEQLGYREPLYSKITQLAPSITEVRSLPVRRGEVSLRIVVFPGHQEADIDNNVVLVTTPEGISVAHTGDQWDRLSDFGWIDGVAQRFRVDILLPNDWTYDIARMVRGFRPSLVIPGHANELGHTVEKRQPYGLSYQRKAGSERFGGARLAGYTEPMLVMAWGESFHYERPAAQRR